MKKKKKPEPEQKQKDFISNPLAGGLKSFRPQPAVTAPKAEPAGVPDMSGGEAELFLRAVGDARRLKGQPVQELPAEDSELFLQAVGDARRLNREPELVRGKCKQEKITPPSLSAEEQAFFLNAVENLRLDVTFEDHIPETAAQDLPRPVNRLRQLRRGAIRLDLELDLHGLTRDEALANLAKFLQKAHQRGQKAVLVITGKGNRSAGEPVLQRAVIGWLREQGKAITAEFAPAPRELGGGGALVVFLKDSKKVEVLDAS